jgi:hypothetical protein
MESPDPHVLWIVASTKSDCKGSEVFRFEFERYGRGKDNRLAGLFPEQTAGQIKLL